jgi:serine/threonine protein kinase
VPERGQEVGARVGETLSHYRVTASLGAGGMGEVYRATDTTLGREVALKLLPGAFASDPERLACFEREAKVLASLNHSGIAHVYGFERRSKTARPLTSWRWSWSRERTSPRDWRGVPFPSTRRS